MQQHNYTCLHYLRRNIHVGSVVHIPLNRCPWQLKMGEITFGIHEHVEL